MSLKAADVVGGARQHGLRWALVSVAATIGLGVVDQFTGRIIPSLAGAVENALDPPKFFVSFSTPVEIAGRLTIASLGAEGATPVKVNRVGERGVAALAGPGAYELRLRRAREGTEQELVDARTIEKPNQTWLVDTSERNWANAAALRSGGLDAPAAAAGPERLSGTRWAAAAPDYAILASVPDRLSRSLLANALAEVGVFENGSEEEKGRIAAYWQAAGMTPQPGLPWGGAFVAWIARQAGAPPPQGAAAFASWRNWGVEVPPQEAGPGDLAIFQLGAGPDVPESRSRLLVGPVLRRQPDCIETILGNIADRVVVTCVAARLLAGARRAQAGSAGE
jgi:hypothetical protein